MNLIKANRLKERDAKLLAYVSGYGIGSQGRQDLLHLYHAVGPCTACYWEVR